MVFMPPRHAKSETSTVRFPVWFLRKNPERRVIGGSYNQTLANKFSRKARRLAETELELSKDRVAVEEWETAQGGGFRAAGVGSGITGHGGDLIIIDDPIKSREEADSSTYREKVWDWYRDDLFTRLEPGGRIVLIQCLAGDTPVLMADGTQRAIENIRIGERVASYESGHLVASTVLNWSNQGLDCIFNIKLKSGRSVRANARHPFLVCEHGVEVWRRTEELRKSDLIRSATGGSGAVSFALSMDVTRLQNARACVARTTPKSDGGMGFARLRSILWRIGRGICDIATELISGITNAWWPNRAGFALCADSLQPVRIHERTGLGNCALTTATRVKGCADFSVMTATSPSATEKPKQSCAPPLTTFEIGYDEVVEVTECGVENVFDIQVERTENFIANGLVSHNTRWHVDDLAGRLLADDPNGWRVVSFPAIATGSDWRKEGEPLWPERFSARALAGIKKTQGARSWSALYQQSPIPDSGAMFTRSWFKVSSAAPTNIVKAVRYWDLAATEAKKGKNPDWTAGVKVGRGADGKIWILDVRRLRGSPQQVKAEVRQTAQTDGTSVEVWIEQEPGSSGKIVIDDFIRDLLGYYVQGNRETGDKVSRARPVASQAEIGNVWICEGAWNRDFLDEVESFPYGAHDDQVDGLSGGFNRIAASGPAEAVGVSGGEGMRATYGTRASYGERGSLFGRVA